MYPSMRSRGEVFFHAVGKMLTFRGVFSTVWKNAFLSLGVEGWEGCFFHGVEKCFRFLGIGMGGVGFFSPRCGKMLSFPRCGKMRWLMVNGL